MILVFIVDTSVYKEAIFSSTLFDFRGFNKFLNAAMSSTDDSATAFLCFAAS
jgi:hypothetical protein